MFKNIIIVILLFLLGSLFVQRPDTFQLLVSDLAETKKLVVKGTKYIKKTVSAEFSDVLVKATESDPFSVEKEPMIRDETFFEEVK